MKTTARLKVDLKICLSVYQKLFTVHFQDYSGVNVTLYNWKLEPILLPQQISFTPMNESDLYLPLKYNTFNFK